MPKETRVFSFYTLAFPASLHQALVLVRTICLCSTQVAGVESDRKASVGTYSLPDEGLVPLVSLLLLLLVLLLMLLQLRPWMDALQRGRRPGPVSGKGLRTGAS